MHAETRSDPLAPDDRRGRLHADAQRAARVADVVKALGHPLRLRLVALLCGGQHYVGELARRLGCTQTLVSQQLRVLRMNGLVTVARVNGRSYYRLAEPRLRNIVAWLDEL